ncbi:type VI secretion system ATPase TssH [Caenispirillum bisanense]|uniref:type VI secretion system ATPase TssH n=1 Tax=Caenispirillum bisanense TaxID=414052 RepID=UPI0031DF73E9
MTIDLKTLISKLDRNAKKVVEQAAALCVSHTHYDVEPEHLLAALVRSGDVVVKCVLDRYDLPAADLLKVLEDGLGRIKRGNARTPAFSPRVPDMLESALLLSVARLESPTILPAALLLGPLERDPLRGVLLTALPALERIDMAEALELLPEMVRVGFGPRKALAPLLKPDGAGAAAGGQEGRGDGQGGSATEALDRFTVDLTAQARAGKLDPVTGRESEIRQLIDVMMRRRQNNPILVGAPGVGKTAVVEGLALRIAEDRVPPPLKGMVVRMLDLGLLQAGAGVKGEFEERLRKLMAEVAAQPMPVVVFIDEAHTMIGAGGAAGQNDAANLLKPALARGEFRTIAATTWSEFKRYFEKDPALARRFQAIAVDEPDQPTACAMLRGLVGKLESHHKVRVLSGAVSAAVALSARYMPARQLPDKAVSVLDTACARVAIGRGVTPAQIERLDHDLALLAAERAHLEREPGAPAEVQARLAAIAARVAETEAERAALEDRRAREQALLDRLDAAVAEGGDAAAVPALRAELAAVQGDDPLVPWCVDEVAVAQVISEWTGIPAGALSRDMAATVGGLEDRLRERVIGQDQALAVLSNAIRAYHAGLAEPGRPVGVFLLCGPSGVGKTETAHALADILYGGSASLITINMSEYQEAHSVATLRGSPPGYVGYGQGGVLTEAVRRRPYSVVLLDEVEKAHPDVLDLFYQVFDKGVMEDGEGVAVDFRHTVILLTSNVAEDVLAQDAGMVRAIDDPTERLSALVQLVSQELRRHFRTALIGRLTVVPYLPLGEDQIGAIVDMRCGKVTERFAGQRGHSLTFTPAARAEIVRRAMAADTGARMVDNVLNMTIVPQLAPLLLTAMTDAAAAAQVEVDAGDDGRLICRRVE